MAKTLAELRASRSVTPPERTYALCLAQGLVAEAQALQEEKIDLALPAKEDGAKAPGRLGRPEDVRLAEIDTRLEALFEDMREHTGSLRVRAIETGEWVRWRDAHPPRQGGSDENGNRVLNPIDVTIAYSWCDASALLADLGRYMVAWNDEPMTPEDWQFISSKAAPGDLKALVSMVVEMHEGTGSRAPKASSKPSPTSPPNVSDLLSPEALASPSDDS